MARKSATASTTRQPKAPKDKNAPSRPMSSYFLFSNQRRRELLDANRSLKITDASKIISEEWKNLTDEKKKKLMKKKLKK